MESLTIIPSKSSPPINNSRKPISEKASLNKTQKAFPSKPPNYAQINHLLTTGKPKEALAALDSIALKGYKLNGEKFSDLLDICIDNNDVKLGRELHARIEIVDHVNVFVGTKLVGMYAKCGCLSDARKVFDGMKVRNLYTWSSMIAAYARELMWGEVVELFRLMMKQGVLPDGFLMPRILRACGGIRDCETGRALHSLAVRKGMVSRERVRNSLLGMYANCGEVSVARKLFEAMSERDVITWNEMISGYFRCGENDEARRLFDRMCKEGVEPGIITWNMLIAGYNQSGECDAAMELMERMRLSSGLTPDVFTWTSMISGFVQNERIDEALGFFREMVLAGVLPNGVTIASAVSACASIKSLEMGKELHSLAVKLGVPGSVLVGNAMIDMYCKCSELEAAHEIFDRVAEKDLYTYNSMIEGYFQAGYGGKAYELFEKMQESGLQPNVITWNSVIGGLIKNGDEEEAMDLFLQMGKRGTVKPVTSTWNNLISYYLRAGDKNRALGLFRRMQSSYFRPNPVTILTVLPTCACLIAANKVKEIHACVLRQSLESHIDITNALIDAYAKSGNLAYSRSVFDCMPSKDLISWNSLMHGYVLHGQPYDALDVYDQMRRQEYVPDRSTFYNCILAYSRAKMIEKGKEVFNSMTKDYQIIPRPDHYSAMVRLFGRSGKLKEAFELTKSMKTETSEDVWEALFVASRHRGNVELAIHAGEQLLQLCPGYNMLNNLVSQAYSLHPSADTTLNMMYSSVNNGSEKRRGYSLIEVNNMVFSFVSGEKNTPGIESFHTWLKGVAGNIKLAHSNNALSINEEEEEEVCGIHSEKLALAFGLGLVSMQPQRRVKCIKIMKNFRICDDCHCTAKLVSATFDCEIFLSDTKNLHHFKNGHCSCGDYW